MAVIKCKYYRARCSYDMASYGLICPDNEFGNNCDNFDDRPYRDYDGNLFFPSGCKYSSVDIEMFEKTVKSFTLGFYSLKMRGLEIDIDDIIKLTIDGEVILDREEATE